MDAVDVLMKTRAYVDKGWTQGWLARTEYGFPCSEDSETARSWCILGALGMGGEHVVDTVLSDEINAALLLLAEVNGIELMDLVAWNDAPAQTKEGVLAAIDGAIALGLQREPA